jgi:hypothetical protein
VVLQAVPLWEFPTVRMAEVPPVAKPVASDNAITIFCPDANGIGTVPEVPLAKVMLRGVPSTYLRTVNTYDTL